MAGFILETTVMALTLRESAARSRNHILAPAMAKTDAILGQFGNNHAPGYCKNSVRITWMLIVTKGAIVSF